MPSRVIKTDLQRDNLITLLRSQKMPLTVDWQSGSDRTKAQNRLQWQWAGDVVEQTRDNDRAGVQAIFKLEIGVPILRAENETFREFYDTVIRHFPYEAKIKMMRDGMVEVTRKFSKKQMMNFLDRVWAEYTGMGIELTNPDPEMVGYMKHHKGE